MEKEEKKPLEVIKEKVEKMPHSSVKAKILEDIKQKTKQNTIYK